MNYLVVCYVFDMYLVLIWMVINKLVIENIFLFLMNREIYFFELKEIGKWKKKWEKMFEYVRVFGVYNDICRCFFDELVFFYLMGNFYF